MKSKLTVLMIVKNSEKLLEKSLESVMGLADEIIAIYTSSTDKTKEILNNYPVKIHDYSDEDLGKKRKFGLGKVTSEWVLVLDADELVGKPLKHEIAKLLDSDTAIKNGYLIPFQNHFLGKPVNHGGENYKILRLFKKNSVSIKDNLVHEHFELISGKTGELKNKIYHYSYQSLAQMFRKFTDYAIRDHQEKKMKREKSSLKKISLYPLHMFWSRFIKDKGYKDGIFRIPLDLGFAYMEFLTYFLLFFNSRRKTQIVTRIDADQD